MAAEGPRTASAAAPPGCTAPTHQPEPGKAPAMQTRMVGGQAECVGLIGDIGRVDGKPALHVHGSVAGADGAVKGGHLLSAVASPTLEVFVTEAAFPLHKREDQASKPDGAGHVGHLSGTLGDAPITLMFVQLDSKPARDDACRVK